MVPVERQDIRDHLVCQQMNVVDLDVRIAQHFPNCLAKRSDESILFLTINGITRYRLQLYDTNGIITIQLYGANGIPSRIFPEL